MTVLLQKRRVKYRLKSESMYEGKLRVRVCGLLVEDGKLLLVRLNSPVTNSDIWMPPGGGVEFGEKMEEALKREFLEETCIRINVHEFLFYNEVIQNNFHAVEFYFRVEKLDGELNLGSDPEHGNKQILKEIKFFHGHEIVDISLKPEALKKLPLLKELS